jgi:hypothetical protein
MDRTRRNPGCAVIAIEVPERIARLPRDEHDQPIPWFAAIVDGRVDLRLADEVKLRRAVADGRCWICGDRFTVGAHHARQRSFIVGPLAAFNRVAPEPPSHRTCALYACRVCPFLTRPAKRRAGNIPEEAHAAPGDPILENPGVSLIWMCRRYDVENHDGGLLFRLPYPAALYAYAEGLPALSHQLADAMARAEATARAAAAADGIPADDIDAIIRVGRTLVRTRMR